MAGDQRSNHRYLARIPIGNNSYRYIYSPQELASYKNKANTARAKVKKKSQLKSTMGHLTTNSTGSVISGYRPDGQKPSSMSDERWAQLQKAWGNTVTGQARSSKNKKKSKKKLMFDSKLVRVFGRR